MSTGLIVAIVVVAIIIIALVVLLPRMRGAARQKKAKSELHSRRETVAGEHREEAAQRENRAEQAEHKARIAEQTAQRERAEASMQNERASMHDRGMADDELIEEGERDRFADVSGPDRSADADRDRTDTAPAPTDRDRTAATPGIARGTTEGTQSPDHQRGREDEGRFDRSRSTEDVPESDRPRTS